MENKTASRLVIGGGFQVIGFALGGLFWWFIGVILSRPDIGIGPSGYGIYGILVSFISFLLLFPTGINIALSRVLQESEEIAEKVKIARFYLITTLIIIAITISIGILIIFKIYNVVYIRNMLFILL